MPRLIGYREPRFEVVTDTITVGDRHTIQVPPRVVVKSLPALDRDPIPPRDWPTAWLVKWRDR